MMISNASAGALADLKSLLDLAKEIANPQAVQAALAEITTAKEELSARFADLENEQRAHLAAMAELAQASDKAAAASVRAERDRARAEAAEAAAHAAKADLKTAKAGLESGREELSRAREALDARSAAQAERSREEQAKIAASWKAVTDRDEQLSAKEGELERAVAAHAEKVAVLKSLVG